ncbi:MAG: folylpolyglutamate synthase/dihydrofolate synthase family protein [Chthoniobacteraceae bacterium]
MNYREAIGWLYGLQVHGIQLGLENIRLLCDALGIETAGTTKRRFIHVAGTNGKGSVCALIAAVCTASRFRTGLYTSPHLVSFRERIRFGADQIPEEDVAGWLTKIRDLIAAWEHTPTFFEITTALALVWFQQQDAEIVILETGMGGRLDATNVVTPAVCVLTPIGLDHMQHLGGTLAEIAREKAGIIKRGVPVVSAPQAPEAEAVFRAAAAAAGAKLTFIRQPLGPDFALALAGSHQRWNAALAFAGLVESGLRPEPRIVREAFASVEWPARFQRADDRIVIDGAHNPPAAAQLAAAWREEFGDEKAAIILGVLADKDASGIISALLPISARVICTPVRSPRALPPAELAALIHAQTRSVTVAESLDAALADARADGGRILIAGSLFLAGEALVRLGLADGEHEWSAQ